MTARPVLATGPLFMGVDCGGTSLRVAAAEADGAVIAELTVPTGDAQERENGLGEAIAAAAEGLYASVEPPARAVAGIGIGLPFVCWDGTAHLCRNVRALDPARLDRALLASLGTRPAITNDVKCAALGEAWLGAARGADPFVYLNIGTGLSAALYAGGSVYQGAHGAAGEIAYWATDPGRLDGLEPGCGPLEEAMSGVGLSGAYLRASGLRLGAADIFGRAERGEALATETIDRGFSYLLPAIANLLTFADPELLVIGGGVSRGLVSRLAAITAYVERLTPFPPRIAFSGLGGRAGLIGAIRLAMIGSSAAWP